MKKIIISRTDSLGDVILTLPLAGFLKEKFPNAILYFIGKTYTQPLIEKSSSVDVFLDREKLLKDPQLMADLDADAIIFVFPDKEIAKLAYTSNIKYRIGTSNRWWHWLYANKRVFFSRKKSELHEAQLNFKLLDTKLPDFHLFRNLQGQPIIHTLSDLPKWYGLKAGASYFEKMLHKDKLNIIFHPKSRGSAREWNLENYRNLAQSLPENDFQIFVTGTAQEGKIIAHTTPELLKLTHVTDMTGKMSLSELIDFMSFTDGIVACSTGPLHIMAALGKHALGLYPPIRPMHPQRWKPIGVQAEVLCKLKECSECQVSQKCTCIAEISIFEVKSILKKWYNEKKVKKNE